MDPVWLALARLTFTDPRAAARALLGAGFPRSEHPALLALVAALGGTVFAAANLLAPPPEGTTPHLSGFVAGLMVGASVFITTGIVLLAGRLFGSRAEAPDAMLLVLWLELLSVAVQAALLVVTFVLPAAGLGLSLLYLFLFIWLLSSFTAELHGLDSAARGFVGLAAATLALGFALALMQAVLSALFA